MKKYLLFTLCLFFTYQYCAEKDSLRNIYIVTEGRNEVQYYKEGNQWYFKIGGIIFNKINSRAVPGHIRKQESDRCKESKKK